MRRFYLKNGYADVQIVSATGEYDPSSKGFIITFTIEEGAALSLRRCRHSVQYPRRRSGSAAARLRMHRGDVYNADAVEKIGRRDDHRDRQARLSVRHGAAARRSQFAATHLINVVFVVEEGARAYIERINIRGNTRTRDYVIRREFDISEGDAYNRALVDRAERRLKNLNFFKTVKITNEPGSAPDRVVINVEVEEQSTGEFSVAGGYSTADGWMARSRSASATCSAPAATRSLGHIWAAHPRRRTRVRRALSSSTSACRPASTCSPDRRLSNTVLSTAGDDRRQAPARRSAARGSGAAAALFAVLADRSTCRRPCTIVNNINPNFVDHFPTPNARITAAAASLVRLWPGVTTRSRIHRLTCYLDGEASLPVRVELANGGYPDVARRLRLDLQHTRQQQQPDQRHAAQLRPGFRRPRRRRGISCARSSTSAATMRSSPISSACCICKAAT